MDERTPPGQRPQPRDPFTTAAGLAVLLLLIFTAAYAVWLTATPYTSEPAPVPLLDVTGPGDAP